MNFGVTVLYCGKMQVFQIALLLLSRLLHYENQVLKFKFMFPPLLEALGSIKFLFPEPNLE